MILTNNHDVKNNKNMTTGVNYATNHWIMMITWVANILASSIPEKPFFPAFPRPKKRKLWFFWLLLAQLFDGKLLPSDSPLLPCSSHQDVLPNSCHDTTRPDRTGLLVGFGFRTSTDTRLFFKIHGDRISPKWKHMTSEKNDRSSQQI